MVLKDIIEAVRYFGVYPILLGTWHRLAKKTGLLKRRFPATDWDNLHLGAFIDCDFSDAQLQTKICPDKFFSVAMVIKNKNLLDDIGVAKSSVIDLADNIANGNFRYFSKSGPQLQSPINWHFNPFSRTEWKQNVHWCDTSCFVKANGDIKCVWELSRFSWAYDLVRAYAVNGDEKYAETFWELFESWLDNNQPNRGVNWLSGQECALRIMAWCFAVFAFINSPSTTIDRIERFLLAVAVHTERIDKFISHAIRQKTNHAIIEAAALYTTGVLFPFFQKSKRWKTLGKAILEKEGLRQIYEDGSYIQQSMNYHRLMLHAYLWCLRLGEINRDSFSERLNERLLKATEFLYQMQDDSTGRVPNYGPNDGALILPLNSCDYLDYRPVVQACWYLLKQEKLFERGPWDEDMLWLFGPSVLTLPKTDKSKSSYEFCSGGYYTLRGNKSWGMIRCHTYRDRVGHVDPLHLDLWADGINLLRDCGTYKYYAPDEPELEYYFKSIWAHNTVVIDNQSPLRLASRFMWLPWPKAKLQKFERGNEKIYWQGKSFAYKNLHAKAIHSRTIVLDKLYDRWKVVDEISGAKSSKLELRWHLPFGVELDSVSSDSVSVNLPLGWVIVVKGSNNITVDLKKADKNGGYESLYYNEKKPINTLVVRCCELPVVFETTIFCGDNSSHNLSATGNDHV